VLALQGFIYKRDAFLKLKKMPGLLIYKRDAFLKLKEMSGLFIYRHRPNKKKEKFANKNIGGKYFCVMKITLFWRIIFIPQILLSPIFLSAQIFSFTVLK
jgi:hypothetical protein